MEKKNILITGRKNAGKSTLVKRVINQYNNYAGFKTIPLKRHGLISTYQMYDFINKTSIPISKYVDNKIIGIPEKFSTFGKECLKKALSSNYPLIIMDELGRFERTSYDFLYYVDKVLNSDKVVIAVIKAEKIDYLEKIKSRKDCYLYDLVTISFEKAYQEIISRLNIFFKLEGDRND